MLADGPTPKHRQVREALLAEFGPGERMPSERALMERFGVARGTVRKAIDDLVADGAARRVHGKGTFATASRLESRLHLASFSDEMRRRGLVPSSRVLALAREPASETAAVALELDVGASLWRLDRVRLADGEPIALESALMPEAIFPALDAHDFARESAYELLARDYGVSIDSGEQTLWGEAATGRVAALLEIPAGTPLLVFERTSSAGGVPVEFVRSRYRADRYQVRMSLTREAVRR